MTNDHLELLARIRTAEAMQVPTVEELAAHLARRQAAAGSPAFAEFAHVQRVAAQRWGAARTAHFGQALRSARVSPKAPRKTAWQRATESVSRLPADWRPAFEERIASSRLRAGARGSILWSAAYTIAVVDAVTRWIDYCKGHSRKVTPTGAGLEAYVRWLKSKTHGKGPVSDRGIADYLTRIVAGYALVHSCFASTACAFVLRDWDERAKAGGSPTKTGDQLVTATRIYDLGFELMERARARRMRGLHAALDFRNGLILTVGTALPQRARALSCLDTAPSPFSRRVGSMSASPQRC